MKKTLQLICIAILFFLPIDRDAFSQPNLLGLTYSGGQGVGAVVKYQRAANTLTSVCNFPFVAAGPNGSLVLANNGKYYGVTNNGGTSGVGVIFSFDKATNTRTDVFNFNSTKGANPNAGMIKASNGKLYGMTPKGGLNDKGVLYSFNTTTNALTVLYNFDLFDGGEPQGELMQATNGKIYGLTRTGGSMGNMGVLFVFDPVAITYQKLYAFSGGLGGSYPEGGLTQYNNSTLFGLTTYGGHSDNGTIFSFDITNNTLVTVNDFNLNSGTYPNGNLLKASNGKLYGTTSFGGAYSGFNGTLFSFDPATNALVKLFDFNNAVSTQGEPSNPVGSLVQGTNGKLYGLTQGGGINPTYQGGSIFSFNLTNNTPAFNFPFSATGGIDGLQPLGSLVQDANGKFYGTTSQGGSTLGWGAIYSFDPATTAYTKLNAFTTNTGMQPVGGLVLANNGKYYGMTQTGGTNNTGTIFSFDTVTNTQTNVFNFTGANGSFPAGSLIRASNGKLYGMTTLGGIGNGTLFSFDPATNTHIKLLDLNGPICEQPTAGLTEASNGKLYGTSYVSFPNPPGYDTLAGVIFSYDILTNTAASLVNMGLLNGASPQGLVQATNGKLYGMASYGGANDGWFGTIFSFDATNNTFFKIFDFDSIKGSNPQSDLIQASNGKLYGMAPYGGSKNCGTIFSLDPATNAVVKLYDFDSINGRTPFGKLMQASDGKLYGMTTAGGSLDNGVVFSYDITNAKFTKLKEFTGPNGAQPNTGNYLTEQSSCTIVPPVIAGGGKLKNCNGNPVTLSTNKIGNAISLTSAANKYINVPHSASVNISAGNAFTIEAWVNVTDNVNNTIVDKGDYDFLFQTHSNGNTGLGFYNRNTGWIYSAGTVPLNQWVHVAVTYNNQTIKFYQNGVLQGTYTTPAITLGDNGVMTIGRQQPAACACNNLDGSMDELRLWNVTRTQAQIQASMNANVPSNSTGLAAYYKFDDNAGPVAKDATANANNGTLVNNPAWVVPSTSPVGYSSYLWSNGATTASISASTSATYTVTVSNVNGCTASSSAIVIRGTKPTVTITPGSVTVCTPYTSLTLTASSSPATYTWKPAASLNTTTGSSVTASLTATTTYTVTATNTDGCTATKTAKILKDPTPTNLTTTNVGATVATANWDLITCAIPYYLAYQLDYKAASSSTWIPVSQVTGNTNFKQFTGLQPSTAYNWRIRASYAPGASSLYSANVNFTTLALREGELTSNENLILFPNPSTGSITLQLTACENCTSTINVYDVLGQMVFTETRKAGGNTGTYDLSKLPKGVYQVKVAYDNVTEYRKLVLQ